MVCCYCKTKLKVATMKVITCTAPVNIAVVKYWGKRDVNRVLPANSSASVTLDQKQLRAKTTVAASADFEENRIWLNGREETIETPRIQNLLKEIKQRAKETVSCDDSLLSWNVRICSENNFPTAAGLASSAAGYACLAYSLSQLYNVSGDISDIARQGSGSACRSIYGGFVVWDKGELADGKDSIARQIAPHTHWPELRVLILVVSDQKKQTGSTAGMQVTMETSSLMAARLGVIDQRIEKITAAILKKDFHTFAELTMIESNQLHAVCLDSYPPISYMTDVSRLIVNLVHAYNTYHGQNKVAYTFDAGPNACLYLLEEHVPMVTSLVQHFFPPIQGNKEFLTGLPVKKAKLNQELLSTIAVPIQPTGAIKFIIHTQPGPGPTLCSNKDSLLDNAGMPKAVVIETIDEPSTKVGDKDNQTLKNGVSLARTKVKGKGKTLKVLKSEKSVKATKKEINLKTKHERKDKLRSGQNRVSKLGKRRGEHQGRQAQVKRQKTSQK
ncbi:diphosphomevalonate decarboxylase-like isoform X2 [Mya arenaria]|uniref:diphosphomevalonate decarboxylase-like isoform X2 n=1 Tax=Mya arenaria TaxID=6604 RepID=UPI0022DEA8B1|nr:diphosphomevalonate decarboxylase-like isoform X2 [Mya arenaria]